MIIQIGEQYLREILDVARRSRRKTPKLRDAIGAAESCLETYGAPPPQLRWWLFGCDPCGGKRWSFQTYAEDGGRSPCPRCGELRPALVCEITPEDEEEE